MSVAARHGASSLGDTIYALSSGRPPAAIAIVRISGPAADATLAALSGQLPDPRVATLATVRDAAGAEIDTCLILWFPAPRSATGENLAELHLHGGIATVDAALRTLDAMGLRHAEPGEFTRRALFNDKIDAGDVEALADLLSAQTDHQRRESLSRSRRHRGAAIADWAARLTEAAATVEAVIDHDESDADGNDVAAAADVVCRDIAMEMRAALAQTPFDRIRDGARIVIAGPVNAGKSSLFNALSGEDAAIVTPRPGTTRDVLERTLDIGGYPVILADTAGLRDTDDAIETIGIARAEAAIEQADLVLDLAEAAPSHPGRISIQPKCDLTIERPLERIAVSARSGDGLVTLHAIIAERLSHLFPIPDRVITRSDRNAVAAAADALDPMASDQPLVLIAEILGRSRTALAQAGQTDGVEPVLDAVYARFCIGK